MEPTGSAPPADANAVRRGTPRWRRIVAFLATFVFPGISQADDGEFRRGFCWFLGLNASVVAGFLFVCATLDRPWLSMGTFAAVLVAGFALTVRLAIDGYRRERTRERRGSTKRVVAIYAVFVVAEIAFALPPEAIKERLVASYRISSISMEPTLLRGDRILADKSAYKRGRHPKAGDVVIFIFPEDREKSFVKRIVAVPGDTVEIRRRKFLVNGKELRDESLGAGDGTSGGKNGDPAFRENMARFRLADGDYFMLGDNRRRSYDSRHFGPIDEADIEGKPAFIYFSPDPGRIGKTIR